jgi:hypothetical protein
MPGNKWFKKHTLTHSHTHTHILFLYNFHAFQCIWSSSSKKFHDSIRICFQFFLEHAILAMLLSHHQPHFRWIFHSSDYYVILDAVIFSNLNCFIVHGCPVHSSSTPPTSFECFHCIQYQLIQLPHCSVVFHYPTTKQDYRSLFVFVFGEFYQLFNTSYSSYSNDSKNQLGINQGVFILCVYHLWCWYCFVGTDTVSKWLFCRRFRGTCLHIQSTFETLTTVPNYALCQIPTLEAGCPSKVSGIQVTFTWCQCPTIGAGCLCRT